VRVWLAQTIRRSITNLAEQLQVRSLATIGAAGTYPPYSTNAPGPAADTYDVVRSSDGSLWQASTLQPSSAQLTFTLAGYGVATVSGSTGAVDLIFADGFE
jgi:hypothetical protein